MHHGCTLEIVTKTRSDSAATCAALGWREKEMISSFVGKEIFISFVGNEMFISYVCTEFSSMQIRV
jgi:hypothetical protein